LNKKLEFWRKFCSHKVQVKGISPLFIKPAKYSQLVRQAMLGSHLTDLIGINN